MVTRVTPQIIATPQSTPNPLRARPKFYTSYDTQSPPLQSYMQIQIDRVFGHSLASVYQGFSSQSSA